MKNIKGSKTERNLLMTFAGESRARNKYDLYAEKAIGEGQHWIANVFMETAKNEFAHGREVFNKYLGKMETTEKNLMKAAMGEAEEADKIYKEFEEIARCEGYLEIADFFKELREVEENHEKRFMELYERLKNGTLYKRDKEEKWECLNCGYIHLGKEAPMVCPLCKYPRGYFKIHCENYK